MADVMTQTRSDIPFNRAALAGNELQYLADAIRMGHISGDGFYTRQGQDFLEKELGARKALLTTSCTHALELAGLRLDLNKSDEGILRGFSLVCTIHAT